MKNIYQILFSLLMLSILAFITGVYIYSKNIYPDFNAAVNNINNISTLVIMILTLFYVIVNSFQFLVMGNQLNSMEKSINLQSYHFMEVDIKKMFLQGLNVYNSPRDNFKSLSIKYRYICHLQVNDIGNSNALNLMVFPKIILKNKVIPMISVSPEELPYVSKKHYKKNVLNFMILDFNYDILKALKESEVIFRVEMFSKNLFGAGFYQRIDFQILAKENNKVEEWYDFLILDSKKALCKAIEIEKSSKNNTDKIFASIHSLIPSKLKKDLLLLGFIIPETFEAKIVNYNKKVKKELASYEMLIKKHSPEDYKDIKKYMRKI